MKKNTYIELLKIISSQYLYIRDIHEIFGEEDYRWRKELLKLSDAQAKRVLAAKSWEFQLAMIYYYTQEDTLSNEIKELLNSMIQRRKKKVYYLVLLLSRKQVFASPNALQILKLINQAPEEQIMDFLRLFHNEQFLEREDVIPILEFLVTTPVKDPMIRRILCCTMEDSDFIKKDEALSALRFIANARDFGIAQYAKKVAVNVSVLEREDYLEILQIISGVKEAYLAKYAYHTVKERNVLNTTGVPSILRFVTSAKNEDMACGFQTIATNQKILESPKRFQIFHLLAQATDQDFISELYDIVVDPVVLENQDTCEIIKIIMTANGANMVGCMCGALQDDILNHPLRLELLRIIASAKTEERANDLITIASNRSILYGFDPIPIFTNLLNLEDDEQVGYIRTILLDSSIKDTSSSHTIVSSMAKIRNMDELGFIASTLTKFDLRNDKMVKSVLIGMASEDPELCKRSKDMLLSYLSEVSKKPEFFVDRPLESVLNNPFLEEVLESLDGVPTDQELTPQMLVKVRK